MVGEESLTPKLLFPGVARESPLPVGLLHLPPFSFYSEIVAGLDRTETLLPQTHTFGIALLAFNFLL